jgi:N-acetylglucosaminyldiphosphoundecaprenol N-acetyl-beta-D-mannosaminyltransferase
MQTVNILGVDIHCANLENILDTVFEWSQGEIKRSVFYVNAHCFNTAAIDNLYSQILTEADLVYPDGISVVWSSKFLGGCPLTKMTGADWIQDFCEFASSKKIKIYILGGKPGIADQAVKNLRTRYPKINILGFSDGYFIDKSNEQTITEINELGPHVLFVGMGTPIQEKWIFEMRNKINVPVCWAVGALFDYLADVESRVPEWMYSSGLEWLWRLMVDPAGKWKRYIIGNPLFAYRILRQKFGSSYP